MQLLFYASPIIYPIGFLPPWAQQVVFLNPFTQAMQDIRALLFYPDKPENLITASSAFGSFGRLVPLAIVACTLLAGYFVFKREEPWFAERA